MIGNDLFHLEVLEMAVPGQDHFQQGPQAGDVPLAVAQLVDQPALRVRGGDLEALVEGPVGRPHPQVAVQHEQRFPHRLDDADGVVAGMLDFLLAPFEGINVDQHQDHAADLVVQGLVRPDVELVPGAGLVGDLALLDLQRVDHLMDQQLQVGHVDLRLEVARAAGPRRRDAGSSPPGRRG